MPKNQPSHEERRAAAAAAAAPSDLQMECRVWPRHACGAPASCQPLAGRATGDFQWKGILHDISVHGIGLTIGRRFEPGGALAIELPELGSQPSVTLMAQVVHATPLPDGRWRLGCALAHDLDSEELQSFLSLIRAESARPATAKEPILERLMVACDRSSQPMALRLRKPAQTVVIPLVTFCGSAGSIQDKTFVVKRLHLTGSWPLTPAGLLNVRLPGNARGAADVRLRVDDCSRHEGRWTIRYWFATRPAPEVLALFGLTENVSGCIEEE
jgi:hypothetical protein